MISGSRHRQGAVPRARLRMRSGFTLVEAIVATVILTGALLAMAGFTVKYQQDDTKARLLSRAQQAANERLEVVRSALPYASLDSFATSESVLSSFKGFSRTTSVTHVGGQPADTVDYRVITVQVTLPNSSRTITKTSIVGAF